jgi:flagellar secretion chaperone FliS
MNVSRQLQAYQENQITTADPGTVLLLLYEGAIESLNHAVTHLAKGDMAEKGKCVLRVNDIINQFLASLDYDAGGDLAQNLEGLYRYMLDQILFGNVYNDPKPFQTVASLLSTLKSGWEEAVVVQRKQAAAGGA